MTRTLSRRTLGAVIICAEVSALIARFLHTPEFLAWPARVVLPTLGVALVPGAALLLASFPRRVWTLTELCVIAFGVSAALVQLATIAALVGHISAVAILSAMVLATLALAVVGASRDSRANAVTATGTELAWWAAVILLGVCLYRQGSPYTQSEDYLHLGVIRRLAWLSRPALDNIYFAPGVIYTYPFPGIHYLMALVSRLGDVDAIFVYHKLRFFWGPVALASTVVVGRRVFGSPAVGLACGVIALAFTAAGTFASVPSLIWGQLAPYSHASDVAMGVLLPATLACVMGFLDAEDKGDRRLFFLAAAGLALMLSIVHIREVIQLLVYLGAFLVFLVLTRTDRTLLIRTALFLTTTLVIAGSFTIWQETVVTHVGSLVGERRADLVRTVGVLSPFDLLQPPLPLFASFVGYYWTMFWAWNPFLLLATAPVVLAFRRRPLAWFILASVLCYLLIIRFPLFGVPYVYLTYFEVLFTPVRNVVFLLQLVAGAAVFLLARACSRTTTWRGSALMVLVCVALGAAWHLPRAFLDQHQDVLVVPVLAWLVWTVVRGRALGDSLVGAGTTMSTFRGRRAMGAAAAVVAIALITTWQATGRPAPIIHVRWADDVGGIERLFRETRFKLSKERRIEGNSWSYVLLDSSYDNVRALVESPSVADTHEVNRAAFVVNDEAPRGTEVEWVGSRLPVLGSSAGFDAVLIALIGVAVFAFKDLWRFVPQTTGENGGPRPVFVYGAALGLASITFTPDLSPLLTQASKARPLDTVSAISCDDASPRPAPYMPPDQDVMVGRIRSCPPTPQLMEWVSRNVPADAVFAADAWNIHPPSVFFPQQFVGWSGLERNFLNPEELFGPYLQFYRRALSTRGVQPFFNGVETDAERKEFVNTLAITHVLVDPAFHDEVVSTLRGNPMFEPQYDVDGWAVFRVRP